MTESEWLSSEDPQRMLDWLTQEWGAQPDGSVRHLPGTSSRVASDCKLRLFACACCRQVWHLLTDVRSQRAVEVAERYADSLTFTEELIFAHHAANEAMAESRLGFEAEIAWRCAGSIAGLTNNAGLPRWFSVSTKHAAFQAALLREIFGNPWQLVQVGEPCDCEGGVLVRGNGESFTCSRCRGKGRLEPDWLRWNDAAVVQLAAGIYESRNFAGLGMLYDCLLDAGCSDPRILQHLEQRHDGGVGWETCGTCLGKGYVEERPADGGTLRIYCKETDVLVDELHPRSDSINAEVWAQRWLARFGKQRCESTGRVPIGQHVRGCWVVDLLFGKE